MRVHTDALGIVLLCTVFAAGCSREPQPEERAEAPAAERTPAAPQAGQIGQGAGSIAGFVFEDRNRNGGLDAGEPRLREQSVLLTDAAGSQQFLSVSTGPDGSFRFGGLPPGDYRVTIEIPDTYERTNDSSFVVSVRDDGSPPEVQFGLAPLKR